jgi:peptide/nickel transport system substrate-binding protein
LRGWSGDIETGGGDYPSEYWNDAERAIIGDLDLVPVSNRVEYWFTNKAQAAMQRYNGPIPASLRLLK